MSEAAVAGNFGISAQTARQLRELFDRTAGLDGVWLFGSRATGKARVNSDIDLVFDAPTMNPAGVRRLLREIADLPTLYRIDALHWQGVGDQVLRSEIVRDRCVFWRPRRSGAVA